MEINLLFTLNTNKINLVVLFLIMVCNQTLNAQALGQDSNGFSSIVLPSTNLNIDGTNNVITISYIQLDRFIKDDKNRKKISTNKCFHENNDAESIKKCIQEQWNSIESNYNINNTSLLYGLELKGTSKTGLATILNNELLANSASINGVFGYHFKNKKHHQNSLDKYIEVKMTHNSLVNKIEEHETKISSLISKMISDGVITKEKGNNRLLKFKKIKDISDVIDEIGTRIENLTQTKEPSINNTERLQEINTQISTIEKSLVIVNSVLNKYVVFPSISTLKGSVSDLTYLRTQKSNITFELNNLNEIYNKYKTVTIDVKLEKYLEEKTWKDVKKTIEKNIGYLKSEKIQLHNLSKNSTTDGYIKKLTSSYNEFLTTLKEYKKTDENLDGIIFKQEDYDKHYIYGKVGFIGKSFLYDLDNGATTKDARIEKRDFQGTRFEIGWTYQLKSYNFFGINISKDYTDNSGSLTSSTYKFKTIDDTVTPNLEVSDEIVALSDPYERFHNYQISGDYVRLISLKNKNKGVKDESSPKVYLNLNPYFRHNFYSDSETLKPNTSFGLGMYAFNVNKNSIAGGFFVQANDVFNVNREKPINFTKQISIGLVFKYALSSFNPK